METGNWRASKADRAQLLVFDYINNNRKVEDSFSINDVKVVWFCKTLQNWKAMVANLTPGGNFYEVTYNGDKQETYIDEYKKVENVCIPD